MNLIQKTWRYIKNNGIKGLFKRAINGRHKTDVLGFYSFIVNDNKIPLNHKDLEKYKDKNVFLNWIIPEMGIGSGGHINIFRFITYLEKNGIHNKIYLFNPPRIKDDKTLREFTKEHFQILNENVELYSDVNKVEFAHGTIATSWQTAYFVRNFNNTISKFYFVQDFEPYFYPLGSEYEFAENTYKFGFRGITAGDWLKDICQNKYNMKADSFRFSYDKDLYVSKNKGDDKKRLFFYARPVTPRRDFELGLLALNELYKLENDLEVIFAGWDVSTFEIPFPHKNAGIISINNLSHVYSQCDMCLILSNTNLSLLPLEVMASNSVVVCSKGENSEWLVNDENSILVEYNPIQIAKTINYYFNHPDELNKIREKGLMFAQQTSWSNEGEKVKQAILKGIHEDGE